MNHTELVRRSLRFVRYYRALWLFGILVALTTSSLGGVSLINREDIGPVQLNLNIQPGDRVSDVAAQILTAVEQKLDRGIAQANVELHELLVDLFRVEVETDFSVFLRWLIGLSIGFYVFAWIAGYVGEAALIKMVDSNEKSGATYGVRHGLRLGWSRGAWRLFLLDVVGFGAACVTLVLFVGSGLLPAFAWRADNAFVTMASLVASASIYIIGTAVMIALLAGYSMVKPFIKRSCVLEESGVLRGIGRGITLMRRHWQTAGFTWLIAAGIRVTWPMLLAPLGLVLLITAGIPSGLGAVIVFEIAQTVVDTTPAILAALAVGIATYATILAAPLLYLDGLREVFLSSLWTLTFREVRRPAPTAVKQTNSETKGSAGLEAVAGA